MKILVMNTGSSTIKSSLIQDEKILTSISLDLSQGLTVGEGMLAILKQLPKDDILAIGHRFVHGGSRYTQSVRLNAKVISDLATLSELAPLHNEHALIGIKECFAYFGNKIPEVAVFDTAFFSHMPKVASFYATPMDVSQKYEIRRYGFHGISHEFLWDRYKNETGKSKAKVITLHLGAGCSASAIDSGRAVDTSMGFTPAEGLMMATRAGDIDCAVLEYLCDKEKKSPSAVMELLNFRSGVLGVSGISADMREVLEQYHENDAAKFAVDLFCYRAVKYIGAYIAALGGVDAIIFSAGIGENAPKIREQIIHSMKWYGITLDDKVNRATYAPAPVPGSCKKISSEKSSVDVYVIATEENLYIAKSVKALLN